MIFRGAAAFFLISSVCVAVAAPATRRAPRQAPPTGPSVCVAAGLGHTFAVQKIGLMVFGNELAAVPIGSWGIDDAVVSDVKAVIGSRFAVRRISFPPAALAGYERPGGPFRDLNKELLNAVEAAAASSSRCDFYIAVTRSNSGYSNTNQTLTGLGILQHGVFQATYLFAVFAIRVYEGQTFALRAVKTPTSDSIFASALTGPGIRGMYRKLDERWWPPTPPAVVQSAGLRNETWALVHKGLAAELPGIL